MSCTLPLPRPEPPHDVATGEGDGATSKEKVFRKQRCLRNSSQKERNDNQPEKVFSKQGACVAPLSGGWQWGIFKREGVQEVRVLAQLLSEERKRNNNNGRSVSR